MHCTSIAQILFISLCFTHLEGYVWGLGSRASYQHTWRQQHACHASCAWMNATTSQELHLIALLPLSLETVPKRIQVLGDQNALMRKVSWAMTYYKGQEWCKVPKNCLAMPYRLYSKILYIYIYCMCTFTVSRVHKWN